MAAREDWARITRGVAEAFSSLSSAIGSVRTTAKEKRVRRRSIQLVSWAGRADTDAWFRAELEQSKHRALIYYTKNQIRYTTPVPLRPLTSVTATFCAGKPGVHSNRRTSPSWPLSR